MVNKALKSIFILFPFIHFFGLYNIFSLPKILFISIGIIYIFIVLIFNNKIKINTSRNISLFLYCSYLFLFILLISIVFSQNVNLYESIIGSVDRYFGYLTYLLIFIYYSLFILLVRKDEINDYIKYIIYSGLFVSIIGIIYHIIGIDYEGRIISTIGQYNVLGIYLVVSFLLSQYYLFEKKVFFSKYLIFLLIILVGIILTKSRIALFISFLGSLYIFLIYLKSISKKNRFWLIGILFISLITIIFLNNERLSVNESNLGSIKSRGILLNYGFKALNDSGIGELLIGNGLESQKNILIKYITPELYLYEKIGDIPDRVHNFVIDSLIEYGIIGFSIMLFSMFILPIGIYLRNKDKTNLDKIIIFIIGSIFLGNFVGFNYPAIMFLNIFLIIFIILSNDKVKDFTINNINKNFIIVIMLIINSFVLYYLFKELLLNYKIVKYNNNHNFVSDIVESDNEIFKQKIFFDLLSKSNNNYINKLSNEFKDSNNQLSLHYVLYYLVNNNYSKQEIEYVANKLYKIYPNNLYNLYIISDICYFEKDKKCYVKTMEKIFSLLPGILDEPDNNLTNFQRKKKYKLLEYIGIESIVSEKNNYSVKLANF